MKRKIITILLFLLSSFSLAAQSIPIITVLDFNVSGISVQEMKGVIGYLSSALFRTGKYNVIDVTKRDALLKELEFSLSDCTDQSCQLKIGRMLSAAMIVVGDITKLGSRYLLSARMLETETANTICTADGKYAHIDELVDDLTDFGKRLAGMTVNTDIDVTKQVDSRVIKTTNPTELAEQPNLFENMVFVQGGTFQMGNIFHDGYDDEEPVHEVTLSSFFISKFEVTLGEFRQFVSATGYRTTAETIGDGYVFTGSMWEIKALVNWMDPVFKQADNHPVVIISWIDAVYYCNWKSRSQGLEECYTVRGKSVDCDFAKNGYRLPTEAEWEYAARSRGKVYKYSWGNGSPSGNVADECLKKQATRWIWPIWTGYDDGYAYTAPVGKYPPNEIGLYDMSGNIWEWCWDWFGTYSATSQRDPQGALSGEKRVMRGGSWSFDVVDERTVIRGCGLPDARDVNYGFRIGMRGR